jgi:hypothetical protein
MPDTLGPGGPTNFKQSLTQQNEWLLRDYSLNHNLPTSLSMFSGTPTKPI